MSVAFFARHSRILGALLMREMTTRFGREGIGFLWVVAEPLAFCFGVMILWTFTKPSYEHGIRVAPFVMTGYMSLILLRHQISLSAGALQANIGLLHHRQVAPLHVYLSRNLLEVSGATVAFIFVYIVLWAMGQVSLPHDPLLLYCGWLLLAWIGMGFALILAGLSMRFEFMELSMRFEFMERLVPLLGYLLIPISGAFFMVAWLPPQVQEAYLYVPFPHPIEMIRAAVFGEFVETHYHPFYALAVGTGFNIFGMLLIAGARDQIDVE
jgi:capsular polysaccharide transport system permease protein